MILFLTTPSICVLCTHLTLYLWMVGSQVIFIFVYIYVVLFLSSLQKAGIAFYNQKLCFPHGQNHTIHILTSALAIGQKVRSRDVGKGNGSSLCS